jgi:hypothetical protein
MFFAYSRESATPYYNLMEILKFENIFKLKIAEISYKIVHGRSNIPSIFLEFVRPAYQQHSYNTRFASNLNFVRPKVKTNYGKHTFQFVVSKIWESIDLKIKS